jgi:hypothetical protein
MFLFILDSSSYTILVRFIVSIFQHEIISSFICIGFFFCYLSIFRPIKLELNFPPRLTNNLILGEVFFLLITYKKKKPDRYTLSIKFFSIFT